MSRTRSAPPGAIVKAGSCIIIPSGFLVRTFTCEEYLGLRWGFSPNFAMEEGRVKQMIAGLLEAQPGLRNTKYMDWANTF